MDIRCERRQEKTVLCVRQKGVEQVCVPGDEIEVRTCQEVYMGLLLEVTDEFIRLLDPMYGEVLIYLFGICQIGRCME